MRLSTNNLQIEQDVTYQLIEPSEGKPHAAVIFSFNNVQPNINSTNQQYSGSLTISKFDLQNNIVSGNFNFQVRDSINNINYNISEGRFDAIFTQ